MLEFTRFVFKLGLNTTIRRGIKHFHKKQRILLRDKYHAGNVLDATIVQVRYKRFCDLLFEDIINEHDEDCRDYNILSSIMTDIYANFDTSEIVTIIDFRLDKS